MAEKKNETLNDQVKKAIEDILSEMSPAQDTKDAPSTYEEFEKEQKRHIRD